MKARSTNLGRTLEHSPCHRSGQANQITKNNWTEPNMIDQLRKSKTKTLDKSRNQPTRQTKQRNQPHGRLQRLDCFDPIARNSPKKSCLFRPIPPGFYPSPRFISLPFLTFSSPPHPFLCLGCSPLPTFSNGGYINSSSYGLRVVDRGANRIFLRWKALD